MRQQTSTMVMFRHLRIKKGDDLDKHAYSAFSCVWVNWSINAGAKCHTAYLCLADN